MSFTLPNVLLFCVIQFVAIPGYVFTFCSFSEKDKMNDQAKKINKAIMRREKELNIFGEKVKCKSIKDFDSWKFHLISADTFKGCIPISAIVAGFFSLEDKEVCPITMHPIREPVRTPDYKIYEGAAIRRWVFNTGCSPSITDKSLSEKELVLDEERFRIINQKLYIMENLQEKKTTTIRLLCDKFEKNKYYFLNIWKKNKEKIIPEIIQTITTEEIENGKNTENFDVWFCGIIKKYWINKIKTIFHGNMGMLDIYISTFKDVSFPINKEEVVNQFIENASEVFIKENIQEVLKDYDEKLSKIFSESRIDIIKRQYSKDIINTVIKSQIEEVNEAVTENLMDLYNNLKNMTNQTEYKSLPPIS